MKCVRHPETETLLTCVTCGAPICPDCMIQTPVGMKCPDCGRAPVPAVYRVAPGPLALTIIIGAVLGMLAGALVLMAGRVLGLLLIFLSPFAGRIVGDAVGLAAGGKRGRVVALAGALSCAVGAVLLAPHLIAVLAGGRLLQAGTLLALLIYRPFLLLFVGVMAVTVYWRVH